MCFYKQTLMNESMTHPKLVPSKKIIKKKKVCALSVSGSVQFLTQSGGVRKAHSFEVYWGHRCSVISVFACTVLFPDIRVQTGSLTQG